MITGYNGLFGMANSSASKYNQNSLDEQQRLQEIYSHLLLADSDGTTLENVDMTTLDTLIETKVNEKLANLQQTIDNRINEKVYSPIIYNGTVITNDLGATKSEGVDVNSFTITEPGNYVIVYNGALPVISGEWFHARIKNGDTVLASTTNNVKSGECQFNITALENLNTGDVIKVSIAFFSGGAAGENVLSRNNLELIKIDNLK